MPGTGSLNLTDAASFQSYVQEFSDELYSRAFYNFATNPYLTVHEGVKGKKVLTKLVVADLARRYAKAFAPVDDTLSFTPRVLEVNKVKVELSIVPKDFETTYLGMFRQKGQSDRDIPFEGYILNDVFGKLDEEFESAIWAAVAAGTPAATDKMIAVFNGFKKIIADLIVAGHTPVTTPGGALTNSNMLQLLEDMWGALHPAYQTAQVDAYCAPETARKYWNNHITKYQGVKPEMVGNNIRLEYGEGLLIPLPGLAGSQRIIMTPRGNLHWGIDAPADSSVFNFEQNKRAVDMWMDFNVGAQVAFTEDNILVVNDLV